MAYISGFLFLYVIILYINKDFSKIKKILISYLTAFIILSYYIINLYFTFFKFSQGGSVGFAAAGKGDWWVPRLADFGLFYWIIIIGLFILLINAFRHVIKKDSRAPVYVFFVYLMFVCILNYFPLGPISQKAFSMRFLWPLFSSLSLGIVLFMLYTIIRKILNVNKDILFIILLIISLSGVFFYINKSGGPAGSMMNEESWGAFKWLREDTPEDSKILFIYGDYYSQTS